VCVILCTRDRTETLARSIKISCNELPDFEVLIVDNAPGTNQTAEYIQETYAGCRRCVMCAKIDQVVLARNCGLQNTQAEIVAYIDDDEIADPTGWPSWSQGSKHAPR